MAITKSLNTSGAGLDGAREDDHLSKKRCDQIREMCARKLQSLASSSHMFTEKDYDFYTEMISEKEMKKGGAETYEKQQQWLIDNLTNHIPATIAKINKLESSFLEKLRTAEGNGWVSTETADKLRKGLDSSDVHWYDKEKFLEKKFPKYYANWQKLGNDIGKLGTLLSKNPAYAELTECKEMQKAEFARMGYAERRGIVSAALAAITAREKDHVAIYTEAKRRLNAAAASGAIASSSIGIWLKRIMDSSASKDKLQAYVSNRGATSLDALITKWTEVRRRFDKIEGKLNKEDIPRGFNFVKTDKFLEWHFSKRLAYVEEAERRFTNIDTEHPLLLQIRRELDAKDWKSASYLMKQADGADLSPKQIADLHSMRKYMNENMDTSDSRAEDTSVNPGKSAKELREVIGTLPASMQSLYIKAIRAGKLDCLCAIMYNRVWCHENNCLDNQQEVILEKTADKDTEKALREGDDNRYRNSSVSGYDSPAVRSYTVTHANSPQILHFDSSSQDTLISRMVQEDSERFRYWSTGIPQGVDYGTHSYIVKALQPRMKSLWRSLKPFNLSIASIMANPDYN